MTEVDLTRLSFELVPIEDLKPDPRNPKIHTQAQLDKLKETITVTGWGRPILANKRTGTIIAGHGAWQAAQQLEMQKVPVTWTDMDPGEALILMVADNRLAELAENDPAALAMVFQEIKLEYPDLNLEATGYSLKEIDKFIPDGGEPEDDDFDSPAAYQAIKDPVTRKGDLWILGKHRVLCGDSTDPYDVKTLMAGKKAKLAVTDPPYNVNYDQKNGSPRKEPPKSGMTNNKIMNDNMSTEEFKEFLDKFMARLFEACKGPVYIFMSCKEWPRLMAAFEEAGGHWSSTIIWNKSNFVLSRKDYHPKFEPILYGWQDPEPDMVPDYQPILYGWRENSQPQHLTERNKSDVWDVAKPGRSVEHPTMKPVELVGEAIKNSSHLGALVLDLFLGSGSTLIAAEQLGRICYGMELDPKYCDVIVKRWEELTGQQAVRIPGGPNKYGLPDPVTVFNYTDPDGQLELIDLFSNQDPDQDAGEDEEEKDEKEEQEA